MESTSPNTLTFDCPACHASLTVPSYLAGVKGPCPRCRAEISAPNPALAAQPAHAGLPAQAAPPSAAPLGGAQPPLSAPAQPALAPTAGGIPGFPTPGEPVAAPTPGVGAPPSHAPVPNGFDPAGTNGHVAPAPEEPVLDGIPLAAAPAQRIPQSAAAAPVAMPAGEPQRSRRRRRLSPLLFILLGLLVIGGGVVAALTLWPRTDPTTQPRTPLPAIPEKRAPAAEPAPVATTPPSAPAPEPDDTPPAAAALAVPPADAPAATNHPRGVKAARQTLDAFLAATTLDERMLHVQTPDAVRPRAQAYYSKHPLQIDNAEIEFKLTSTVPNSAREFHIFQFTNAQHEDGFPVSVEETNDGLKVDWASFVEFHDNALGKFINIFHLEPQSFHCIVERAHYFRTDVPDLGSKICLRVQPPIPGYEGYAFIDSASPLAKIADEKFEWDHRYFPILKLKWVHTKEGQQYIEVVELVQDNWRAIR